MGIAVIATLGYAAATGLLVRVVIRDEDASWWWLWPTIAALLAHSGYHLTAWRTTGGPDMHFFAALSLVGLGMALLTTLFAASGRMRALGVVVFPLAALMLIGYASHGHQAPGPSDWRLQLHAWCALLAYSTLAIAALLAIMLWFQERSLRLREFHGWLRALPPLADLEALLLRTIVMGFILLSATLLTGALFVQDLFDQHLAHKSVLSVLSWLTFGMLLLGRARYGWRGGTLVRWTLVAMLLLILAFFGSQFVLELVLRRG